MIGIVATHLTGVRRATACPWGKRINRVAASHRRCGSSLNLGHSGAAGVAFFFGRRDLFRGVVEATGQRRAKLAAERLEQQGDPVEPDPG